MSAFGSEKHPSRSPRAKVQLPVTRVLVGGAAGPSRSTSDSPMCSSGRRHEPNRIAMVQGAGQKLAKKRSLTVYTCTLFTVHPHATP